MKKIIASILVAVMMVLALASCGYSFAKDDLSQYAIFSDANKAIFADKLKDLVIEDGDFTTDEETRKNKVVDDILSSLAATVDVADKKTEGTPAANDLLLYCYYAEAKVEGEVRYFFSSNMKDTSSAKAQLGLSDNENLAGKVAALLKDYTFGEDSYKSELTGTAKEGDVVFVTYTYSYTESVDGVETEKSGKVTSERIIVTAYDEENPTFAGYLCNKAIGSSITSTKITEKDDERGEVSYSGIKIDFVARGEEVGTVNDTTYTDEKKVSDIYGKSYDLKNVDITYHVYPVGFVTVPEFNAFNVIVELFGDSISLSALETVLFDDDYADKTEDEKADILKKYEVKDKEGKTLTLEDLAKSIATLQSTLDSKKETLEKAEEDVTEKQEKYDSAAKTAADAGDEATDEQKNAVTKAKEALDKSKEDCEAAKTDYETALTNRDEKVNLLLSIENIETEIVDGYKEETYNYLLEDYNNTIKMNLAKEIYYYICEYITVNGVPEDAVDETYDQLIQNYQYKFYNEDFDSTNKVSNYSKYSGSFKSYLVAAVSKDIKTVTTYEEAEAAIRDKAEEYVEPIVRIYVASAAYGLVASDKEFDDYKDDTSNNYFSLEYQYGENSVRHAYQLDKLLNHFLESEEDDDGNVTYKKVTFTFGTPASEEKDDAEK